MIKWSMKSAIDSGVSFNWKAILHSILQLKKLKCWKKCRQDSITKISLFESGCDKLKAEIDVVSLIHSARKSDIISNVLFDDKQQAMWRYQRQLLIEESQPYKSSFEDSIEQMEIQRHVDIDAFLDCKENIDWDIDTNRKLIHGMLGVEIGSSDNRNDLESKLAKDEWVKPF